MATFKSVAPRIIDSIEKKSGLDEAMKFQDNFKT